MNDLNNANKFVLPPDVILAPVIEVDLELQRGLDFEEGDFIITRPRLRTRSKMLDAGSAELLQLFREPRTIVETIIAFARAHAIDPEETLTEAFPILQHLVSSHILVNADSEEAEQIVPSLDIGQTILGSKVVRSVQTLHDTEVYQVEQKGGGALALKIARASQGSIKKMFDREASVLRHLDGRVSPRLVDHGHFEGRAYLLMEWRDGISVSAAANQLRHLPVAEGRNKLLKLGLAVLDAYSEIHRLDVIHSDVHPGNVLVADSGAITLIDFGYARLNGPYGELSKSRRGGIEIFFEPEYAIAKLERRKTPPSSALGEQYALASLIYLLFTGKHHLNLFPEKSRALRQIAETHHLPFTEQGVEPWPEAEDVLAMALSKNPSERYDSVSTFAAKLKEAEFTGYQGKPAVRLESHTERDRIVERLVDCYSLSGKLFEEGFQKAPTASITFGVAGLAYGLYQIACLKKDSALLCTADAWSLKAINQAETRRAFYNDDIGITENVAGRVSPYHTASGLYCVQAHISEAMGDFVSLSESIQLFVESASHPCENIDLTLGRSGVLLACSQLVELVPETDLVEIEGLLELGNSTCEGIWAELRVCSSIESDADLQFTGVAHGWGGIIYATLRWCQASGASVPEGVYSRLEQLAAAAEVVGRGVRWSRKVRSDGRKVSHDYMPGWCNGPAGMIHLWTIAHQMFGDNSFIDLAEKSAWNTWEEQSHIASLCCGLAGQAYGLLNLYKYTSERAWLFRAEALVNKAATRSGSTGMENMAGSLYKGEAGVAVLAADMSSPDRAIFPFFERHKLRA